MVMLIFIANLTHRCYTHFMSTVTLRIPVSKTLYDKAEAASLSHGFSLEEMVKILIRKLTKKEVTVVLKEQRSAALKTCLRHKNLFVKRLF